MPGAVLILFLAILKGCQGLERLGVVKGGRVRGGHPEKNSSEFFEGLQALDNAAGLQAGHASANFMFADLPRGERT